MFYDRFNEDLERAGLRTLYLKSLSHGFEQIAGQIRMWGRITGGVEAAEHAAADFEARVAAVRGEVGGRGDDADGLRRTGPGYWTPGARDADERRIRAAEAGEHRRLCGLPADKPRGDRGGEPGHRDGRFGRGGGRRPRAGGASGGDGVEGLRARRGPDLQRGGAAVHRRGGGARPRGHTRSCSPRRGHGGTRGTETTAACGAARGRRGGRRREGSGRPGGAAVPVAATGGGAGAAGGGGGAARRGAWARWGSPFVSVVEIAASRLPGFDLSADTPAAWDTILWELRLPRVALAGHRGRGAGDVGRGVPGAVQEPAGRPVPGGGGIGGGAGGGDCAAERRADVPGRRGPAAGRGLRRGACWR